MIDDVKRLIEQLREPVWGESVRVVNDRLRTAALFLESLAAELEKVKQERDGLSILLGQAKSMLETRTRERDAAVEDILKECHKCKHFKVMFNGCTPDYDCDYSDVCEDGNHWQWRGVKEG